MIVIINPNSTEAMTDAMIATGRAAVPGAQISGWTSVNGPPAIQGAADGELALPHLIALVKKANQAGAKAIIIGCFDDTGLDEARAVSECPVIGIGQAAYHMAALIGPVFSVVTTLAVSVPVLEANLKAYGLDHHAVRVRASGVPVLALEDNRAEATRQVLAEIDAAHREDGVRCVVLGCAGMSYLLDVPAAPPQVRLIDGVQSAVRLASMF